MISNFVIRSYDSADLQAIKKLIDNTIDQCYPLYYQQKVIDFFKDYHSLEKITERATTGHTIVHEINNEIIGTATLLDNYLSSVYVLARYQKRGIARKLVDCLISKAGDKEISQIILDSTPGAVSFYLSMGFTIQEEQIQWIDEIFPLPYIVMQKVL